jgi:hypothetical protein
MKLKPNLAYRKIDFKTYIVDMPNSMLHSINETGSEIIDLLNKNYDIDTIAKKISKKHNVDENVVRQDVEEFILLLKEKDILE